MKTIDEIRKQFEPRTKGGYQYRIIEEFEGQLFGRVLGNEVWFSAQWDASGRSVTDSLQLIPVLPPELTILWDKLPEWVDWFAIDRSGDAFAYARKPQLKECGWIELTPVLCFIPSRYYSNPGIPLDKSLRCRPGSEVKP